MFKLTKEQKIERLNEFFITGNLLIIEQYKYLLRAERLSKGVEGLFNWIVIT